MKSITELLPDGVKIISLTPFFDARGVFYELFREEWETGMHPFQWSISKSKANVMRGMHVHKRHADYVSLVSGQAIIALHDIRTDSPTSGFSIMLNSSSESMNAIFIPVGVVHGFYFTEPSTLIYAQSHYWNIDEEVGCHWTCPELDHEWPCKDPILSEKDGKMGSYEEMLSHYRDLEIEE